MSSTTSLLSTQDISNMSYHAKISYLLQRLEQDVAELEAQFRNGPPKATPITQPGNKQAYTPTAPRLPSLAEFPAMPMDRPLSPPMHTPSMPSMPSMYIPSFPLRAELYREVREYPKPVESANHNLRRDLGLGYAHEREPEHGEAMGDGREEEEVYDPANPIMESGSSASRPYDFERSLRKRPEDSTVVVEMVTVDESELRGKEMDIDENEIDYEEDEDDEEEEDQIPDKQIEEIQTAVQGNTQQQENPHPEIDGQRDTIETDSPSNHTSEKFWAQLFSEKSKMELGGPQGESGEEPVSKNTYYSPFERSPAPEIPSPSVEKMTGRSDGLDKQWKQMDVNVTSGGYWSAPPQVGVEEDEGGDGGKEGKEDYFIDEEHDRREVVHPRPDGEGFWNGSLDALDVAKDTAMPDAEDDEYEYDFDCVGGEEEGEGEQEYAEGDGQDVDGEGSDDEVDYEEEEFMDSE
ncbi:uncharacterized protein RAG0_05874 [Rhynchosporium agropyri]|uniref:Uncharacterized protein n=1 Tax=Rhynchosporium agropyri TaxID=914238 RepID=A0A1E1KEY1_9HELO|nr:uncharacterized protein RAG0_05874 [Rhynchosporium agropyri]